MFTKETAIGCAITNSVVEKPKDEVIVKVKGVDIVVKESKKEVGGFKPDYLQGLLDASKVSKGNRGMIIQLLKQACTDVTDNESLATTIIGKARSLIGGQETENSQLSTEISRIGGVKAMGAKRDVFCQEVEQANSKIEEIKAL